MPSTAVPVITTSGRVAPNSVDDTVLLVEDAKYRVQKLFPLDGTVVLQKINTRDRLFKRLISQLWVRPPSTHDVVADADIPLVPCLYPNSEPPRLLPDTYDSTTQMDIPSTTKDLDKRCSLMTDYSSMDRLQQAFDEARVEVRIYFDLNSQLLTDLAAVGQDAEEAVTSLKTQVQILQQDNKHLRSSLTDINATHSSLMAHSLSQTEQIGKLLSRLPKKQPPLLPFLRTLLLNLPINFTDDNIPDDLFYQFLCADPAADQTTLVSNANTLLRFLHPATNPDDPAVKAAGHLKPLITHIKRVLTIPALRIVYDHCVLTGLHRLLNHKLRCIHCMLVEDTGPRVGQFTRDPWNTLSYTFYSRTALSFSLLSGATSVCDVGPSGWGLLDTSSPFSCVVSTPRACLVSCFFHYVTHVLFSAHQPSPTWCSSLAPVLLLQLSIPSLMVSFSDVAI